MNTPEEFFRKPPQMVAGDLQWFKWPKGVKKIQCDGYTITRVPHPTDKPRRKKSK